MGCDNPIRVAREAKKMNREQLGEIIGVSGRTVSYWETWRKIPGPDKIPALRKVLDLTAVDVWRATQHRTAPKIKPERGGSIW